MKLPWGEHVAPVERALLLATFACLIGTVTNMVPLSAGLALGLWLVPLLLLARRRVPRVGFALGVLLLYFLLWTLLYHPASLAEYGFYRRDGNVFITFAPLLLLSLLRLDVDVERIARGFLYVAGGLNVLFLAIYAATGGTIFFHQEGIYHFLFYAHNAAGGFLAALTALSIAFYLGTRERRFLLLSLTNAAGLLATVSRGSVLGLLVALGIVLVLRGRWMRSMVAAMALVQLVFFVAVHRMAPPGALVAEHPAVIDAEVFEGLPRAHTIAIRAFYLWPRAWELFVTSPFIGTGFGSYNDLPYRFRGPLPLVQVNQAAEVVYSDSHAHHTFLHVMAETGLLGLGLLLWLLYEIHRFILRIRAPALRQAFLLLFWLNVVSSFTEHRLFTPSQMLPFTILLGLAVANREYLRWRAERAAQRTAALPARPAAPVPAGG